MSKLKLLSIYKYNTEKLINLCESDPQNLEKHKQESEKVFSSIKSQSI